jgi:transcription antitermination factor NusG
VEAMIDSVDAKGFLCLQQTLKPGTQVRLAAGPFAKQLGTLDRLGDSGRVRVLLEILVELFPFSSNANS